MGEAFEGEFLPPGVTPEIRELADELNRIRGSVLTCYGQVEYSLAELIVRCSTLEIYEGVVPKNYPRRVKDRINGLKRVAAAPGPLEPYRAELEASLDHILTFTDLRDFMAHAAVVVVLTPVGPLAKFEMYGIGERGSLRLYGQTISFETLRQHERRIVLYTGTVVELIRRIIDQADLPPRLGVQGEVLPDL